MSRHHYNSGMGCLGPRSTQRHQLNWRHVIGLSSAVAVHALQHHHDHPESSLTSHGHQLIKLTRCMRLTRRSASLLRKQTSLTFIRRPLCDPARNHQSQASQSFEPGRPPSPSPVTTASGKRCRCARMDTGRRISELGFSKTTGRENKNIGAGGTERH
eukprot:414541-Rhodomonas_salina.2